MKTRILISLVVLYTTEMVKSQNVPFDAVTANYGWPKPITWHTSNWGAGFGHKMYNADQGGKTYLRIDGRHNNANFSNLMSISSDGLIGIGVEQPNVALTVKGSDANSGFGWNTKSAMRICNTLTNVYGKKSELQFAINEDFTYNLACIAGEYSAGGGTDVAGDLVFGTNPVGSNIVERMRLTHDGSLLIRLWDGVTTSFKVDQFGFVQCRQLTVHTNVIADYVFEKDYHLLPLGEVKKFISENKHLPGFEPAEYYIKNGINATEFMVKEQEKIEELTLYIIALEEKMTKLEAKLEQLEK